MIEHSALILLDTNVIIEATRVGCWKSLVGHYRMKTVEKCVEECATGNQRSRNPVPVDTILLSKQLDPKKVGPPERAALFSRCPLADDLDDGEKDLLAYAITLDNVYYVSSPDRKCIRVGYYLGILDSFVSLETLTSEAGMKAALQIHHTEKWLSQCRTELKMETLLENSGET